MHILYINEICGGFQRAKWNRCWREVRLLRLWYCFYFHSIGLPALDICQPQFLITQPCCVPFVHMAWNRARCEGLSNYTMILLILNGSEYKKSANFQTKKSRFIKKQKFITVIVVMFDQHHQSRNWFVRCYLFICLRIEVLTICIFFKQDIFRLICHGIFCMRQYFKF